MHLSGIFPTPNHVLALSLVYLRLVSKAPLNNPTLLLIMYVYFILIAILSILHLVTVSDPTNLRTSYGSKEISKLALLTN